VNTCQHATGAFGGSIEHLVDVRGLWAEKPVDLTGQLPGGLEFS